MMLWTGIFSCLVLITTTLSQEIFASPVPQGNEFRVNNTTLNSQLKPSVASDSNGNYVVVWEVQQYEATAQSFIWGIFGRLYDSSGNPRGDEFRINNDNGGNLQFSKVAMDASGNFVVVWASGMRRFNSAGVPQGNQVSYNTVLCSDGSPSSIYFDPSIAMDAVTGNYVVVWQPSCGPNIGEIYGRRFNSQSEPQGAEFQINTYTSGNQGTPVVAMSGSGFVVAWQSQDQDGSGYGIYGQRYDAAVIPQGAEFRANTFTNNNQSNPTVAMDGSGNFVIGWESQQQNSGSAGDIYAQRYDSSGLPQGSEFRVNTSVNSSHHDPSFAMNSSGSLVATWFRSMGPNNILARHYDTTGAPQGGEIFVTYTNVLTQFTPSATLSDNGNSVIVWASNEQDGSGLGVFGQRFGEPDPSSKTLYLPDAVIPYGAQAPVKAIYRQSGVGIAGKTISFKLNGVNVGSGVTDANGIAMSPVVSTTGINIGEHPTAVTANFAGDATSGALNAVGRLVVVKGFPNLILDQYAFHYDGQPHPVTGAWYGHNNEYIGPAVIEYQPPGTVPIAVGTYNVSSNYPGNEFYRPVGQGGSITIFDLNTPPVATFTVTNTNDSGTGSLRQAISDANNTRDRDKIVFNIPGTGPHTISPTSPLPPIIHPLIIDGTTQPGFLGAPIIELNGNSAGTRIGLELNTGMSIIRGLVINRFFGGGIGISNSPFGGISSFNLIEGNYIGTDVTGNIALSYSGNITNVHGIQIMGNTSHNTIGGTTPAARNVISGNKGHGISISSLQSRGNKVIGNYIGTNAAGTARLGNGQSGVHIRDGWKNIIGGTDVASRNVISANSNHGVLIEASLSQLYGSLVGANLVKGNFIGTAVDGVTALGNAMDGVRIGSTNSTQNANVKGNVIGGMENGAGNTIAFNTGAGVFVGPGAVGNPILSNSIFSNRNGGNIQINQPTASPGINLNIARGTDSSITVIGGIGYPPGQIPTVSTTFNVQFFSSTTCNSTGLPGEGQTYLGSQTVTIIPNLQPFTATLPVSAPEGRFITATVTDPNNNTSGFSSACIPNVINGTDLRLTMSVGPTAAVNRNHIYNLSVFNNSPNPATNVVLTLPLPAGFQFIESDNNSGCGMNGNTFTCNISSIPSDGTFTVIATVKPSAEETVTSTASVTSDSPDPYLGNNTASRSIRVISLVGDTFTVTNTNTSGAGSFSQALIDSNSISGVQTIAFNILGGGIKTISLGSFIISQPVIIDGTTQPGYVGTPLIELRSNCLNCGGGLTITAGDTTIRGLSITNISTSNTNNGIIITAKGGNIIEGNYIGIDPNGAARGYKQNGIYIDSPNNRIGATTAGAGNVIANNLRNGVFIYGGTAMGNTVLSNSIHSNGQLGISLANGGNGNQAAPVLDSVKSSANRTFINGSISSAPNSNFTLQLFSNNACDSSGGGEGQNFISSNSITTDGSGNFRLTLSSVIPIGNVVTATATSAVNSTSPFSQCKTVEEGTNVSTPTITWSNPANIDYGTSLGSNQLNAVATFNGEAVPGTFAYSPASGTVLDAGNNQTLTVTFTPTDTATYTEATATVNINVLKVSLTVNVDSKSRRFLEPNSAFTGTVSGVVNNDNITATFNSTATSTSAVGPYPITAAMSDPNNRLGNYDVTTNNGTLTIEKASSLTSAGSVSVTDASSVPLSATIRNSNYGAAVCDGQVTFKVSRAGNVVSTVGPVGCSASNNTFEGTANLSSTGDGSYSVFASFDGGTNHLSSSGSGNIAVGSNTVLAPSISGISPASAQVNPQNPLTLTISGSGFNQNSAVLWKDPVSLVKTSLTITNRTSNELTATIPVNLLSRADAYQITVDNTSANTTDGESNSQTFFVTAQPVAVTSVTSATADPVTNTATASTSGTAGTVSAAAATSSGTAATGTLTLAQYAGDPIGNATPNSATTTFSATGNYFDVHVSSGSTYSTLSLNFCNTGGSSLYWFDGFIWQLVSPQTYNAQTGCIAVTLNNSSSSPNISQLTGTVIGVAGGPEVKTITVSPSTPQPLGNAVNLTAGFVDPAGANGAVYRAEINWGDGTTTPAQGGTPLEATYPITSFNAAHTYAATGVYSVKVKVTRVSDGSFGSATYQQYVVIYDASGGFVTGGGWISSPKGAYLHNPDLVGKASFGFSAKYQKGANTPSGTTQFNFYASGMNFHSESYDWLVVGGAKAQFKGKGKINGAGNYGFMLTAVDGQINGGGADKFRIKIWDIATGVVVYDNQRGADDETTPNTILGGGSIVIHK